MLQRGGRLSFRSCALCGARGIRTPDILLAKQALYQLSYGPDKRVTLRVTPRRAVGLGGVEPPTSRLSGVRSNHLSYSPRRGGT